MPPAAKSAEVTELPVNEYVATHTLDLGEKVFTCQPRVLPFGTLLKYAEQDLDLRAMHHLVVKLIHPDQLNDVWDAMDEVGLDQSQAAIIKAMESYTERPTQ